MTTMNQDKQHNRSESSNGSKNGHGSEAMSDNQKKPSPSAASGPISDDLKRSTVSGVASPRATFSS